MYTFDYWSFPRLQTDVVKQCFILNHFYCIWLSIRKYNSNKRTLAQNLFKRTGVPSVKFDQGELAFQHAPGF